MANNKRYEGTRLQGGRRMVAVTSGLDTHPLLFPADLVGTDFNFTPIQHEGLAGFGAFAFTV